MNKILCLLLITILISSCDLTGAIIYQTPEETGPPIEILFCPQDNCEQKFIEVTQNANTIDCAFFDLDLNNTIHILKVKDSKVVIDKNNLNDENKILNPILDNNNQYMHNKFCIINNEIVWTGSMNPTINGNNKNNNNVLIIHSKYLAQNYKEEFNELYNQQFGKGTPIKHPIINYNNQPIENYFCPEDNCKQQIIQKLDQANQEIIVMAFSFTDKEIANKLIEKANQGLKIKVLFEKRRINMQYNVYKYLNESQNQNLKLFTDNNPHIMHHKTFIIDKNTVITGSMNPTKSGNEKNDENILILEDQRIANSFLEEFQRLTS